MHARASSLLANFHTKSRNVLGQGNDDIEQNDNVEHFNQWIVPNHNQNLDDRKDRKQHDQNPDGNMIGLFEPCCAHHERVAYDSAQSRHCHDQKSTQVIRRHSACQYNSQHHCQCIEQEKHHWRTRRRPEAVPANWRILLLFGHCWSVICFCFKNFFLDGDPWKKKTKTELNKHDQKKCRLAVSKRNIDSRRRR